MSKAKIGYLIVVLVSMCFFSSCCDLFDKNDIKQGNAKTEEKEVFKNKKYGSYLSGRVAHLRRDFNTAADYYVEVINQDPSNTDLVSRLYVILSSEGRVSEAAKYAKEALKTGDKNNFTYIIIAVDDIKKQQYDEALEGISNLKGPVYDELINPLMASWTYVGKGQKDKALNQLKKIKKEPSLEALYNFHAGMINDYFDDKVQAEKNYRYLIEEAKYDMSYRALQLISNFYIRNGEKEKAIELVAKYNDDKNMIDMLKKLHESVKNADPEKTQKLLTGPDSGLAEALFSIAATLRQGPSGVDLSHVFICLSIYSNQDYDLAKLLLADILESREMYVEANNAYSQIAQGKETYYTAQMKIASNYTITKQYEKAENVLRQLMKNSPNDYQLLLDLGDNLRMLGRYNEAIEYYNKAISGVDEINEKNWVAFYALGVAYERNNQWDKAEESLKKAIELGQNHFIPLNYLGYCWVIRGQNIEEAFAMIVDAYNQAPNDGHIADSLGWALYKLGMYNEALQYLERASEIEPANALVSDHLGDVYWFSGRKIEAVFQWQHVFKLQEDVEEVDMELVKNKIANGLTAEKIPEFDRELILEKMKSIAK